MEKNKFRHLPVVNEAGAIVGVLSKRELKHLSHLAELPVGYAMASPAIHIDEGAPLRDAIFKMLDQKISSILVANQEGLAVGIITTDDLLWYLCHLLEDNRQKRFSFSSLVDLQTVGEVARQIAATGI